MGPTGSGFASFDRGVSSLDGGSLPRRWQDYSARPCRVGDQSPRIAVTRFFGTEDTRDKLLRIAIIEVGAWADQIVVCVNTSSDKSDAANWVRKNAEFFAEKSGNPKLKVVALEVNEWNAGIGALDVAVNYAKRVDDRISEQLPARSLTSTLTFFSAETPPSKEDYLGMLEQLKDRRTVVAGLEFESHHFEGEHNGVFRWSHTTGPRNTASLWRVGDLPISPLAPYISMVSKITDAFNKVLVGYHANEFGGVGSPEAVSKAEDAIKMNIAQLKGPTAVNRALIDRYVSEFVREGGLSLRNVSILGMEEAFLSQRALLHRYRDFLNVHRGLREHKLDSRSSTDFIYEEEDLGAMRAKVVRPKDAPVMYDTNGWSEARMQNHLAKFDKVDPKNGRVLDRGREFYMTLTARIVTMLLLKNDAPDVEVVREALSSAGYIRPEHPARERLSALRHFAWRLFSGGLSGEMS